MNHTPACPYCAQDDLQGPMHCPDCLVAAVRGDDPSASEMRTSTWDWPTTADVLRTREVTPTT